MDVAGAAQTKSDHPGAGGLVRQPIDQDKGSGVAIIGIRVEGHRRCGREIAEADIVQTEALIGEMGEGTDIDAIFERGDRGRHGARTDLQQI